MYQNKNLRSIQCLSDWRGCLSLVFIAISLIPFSGFTEESQEFSVSTKSILQCAQDFSQVKPSLNLALQVQFGGLLVGSGPLGPLGPLGAYGPLGTLGPIGSQVWNVSQVMGTLGEWSELSKYQSMNGGPLSRLGPLGEKGPLSPEAIRLMNAQVGFVSHLGAGGIFTVLGPFGPLGATGPLGPLGPMGAHGFKINSRGEYLQGAFVQRMVEVDYNDQKKRTFELFENYPEQVAKSMLDNDTSFMVRGRIDQAKGSYESDSYLFSARENQLVTIVVTPEYSLDQFSVKLTSTDGHQQIVSDVPGHINFVQFYARQGVRYQLEITLLRSNHFLSKNYRAFVTSISSTLAQPQIVGPHQVRSEKTVCQSVL